MSYLKPSFAHFKETGLNKSKYSHKESPNSFSIVDFFYGGYDAAAAEINHQHLQQYLVLENSARNLTHPLDRPTYPTDTPLGTPSLR